MPKQNSAKAIDPASKLSVGAAYTKESLRLLLEEPSLLPRVGGIYWCQNSSDVLLFVDLDKSTREDEFLYRDFYEGTLFHWDSQKSQDLENPTIQQLIKGELRALLFVRVVAKLKGVTQPFVYCGRAEYADHVEGTSNPVHMIFQSLDFDEYTNSPALLDVYSWKPDGYNPPKPPQKGGAGRKRVYRAPSETERKGLVTSRVGQGYYRNLVLEKWRGTCALTGISIKEILIASHIVPWRDASNSERLDPENSILLSPGPDALFDRRRISFNDDGTMLVSRSLSDEELAMLGLSPSMTVDVTPGMTGYLARHRKEFALLEERRMAPALRRAR